MKAAARLQTFHGIGQLGRHDTRKVRTSKAKGRNRRIRKRIRKKKDPPPPHTSSGRMMNTNRKSDFNTSERQIQARKEGRNNSTTRKRKAQ